MECQRSRWCSGRRWNVGLSYQVDLNIMITIHDQFSADSGTMLGLAALAEQI